MYSPVATALFSVRNGGKTTNGDIGRFPVTVGQSAAALKAFSQTNSAAAKPIRTILNNCSEIAKSDKIFNGLSKTVKFASKHVNPLIAASSGLKVALADKKDRKNTLISESGCIAGMLLGEGWMKKNLDGVLTKLTEKKCIPGGKWLPIIKGAAFVAGSVTASTIGQKIGKTAAKYCDKPLENTATTSETSPKVCTSMDVKA